MTTQVPANMTVEGVTAAQISALTTSVGTKANDSAVVHNTGNETIAGVKTFSSQPIVPAQSMIRLNTANGYGSTSTMIRRFTNTATSQGSDITYADSATLGATFTINTAGVYSIGYSDQFSAGGFMGISLNTTAQTTGISTIPAAENLASTYTQGANASGSVSWTGYLAAGAIVRAHTAAGTTGSIPNCVQFTITRVS